MISKLTVFATIVLESLPISSSAHLQLLYAISAYLNHTVEVLSEGLEFALHGPFAFMLALFFFKPWISFVFYNESYTFVQLIMRFACIELITVFFYSVFSLVGKPSVPLWIGFFISALCLASLSFVQHTGQQFNYHTAVLLGVIQGIALIPGLSRFALTFVAARWCGFTLHQAFQLSFLIEWPLLVAGSIKGVISLLRYGQLQELLNLPMCFVMLIAAISAAGALKGVWIVFERNYTPFFALYLGVMSAIVFFIGK